MIIINYKMCIAEIKIDLYRHTGELSLKCFVRNYYFNPGYKFMVIKRITFYFSKSNTLIKKLLFQVFRLYLKHLSFKFGIQIPSSTQIGYGFLISHFGSIVVHKNVIIGDNCNISQDVTIGIANRGEKMGVPQIYNNVYLGPGAKIFGNIRIGNNVAIGANCVVTKDVPDNSVVVGIPGRVISTSGSASYIKNTDYLKHIKHLE